MDVNAARDRLAIALHELAQTRKAKERRERYFRGDHDLPYAPEGVNTEYQDLQRQAIANWIQIAVGAPVQRLRGDLFRTNKGDELDKTLWRNVWQANSLDERQSQPYREMMMHGRGIVSVWPNKANRARPIVRPESNELVYVHPSEDDPYTAAWAVKVFEVKDYTGTTAALILPTSNTATRTVAIVYDADSMMRLEKGGRSGFADFQMVLEGEHPMEEVPFVTMDYRPDSKGQPWSPMDPLIPQQDAINTIRFNTLLAMQFSAYRQRIVVGFDPVIRDGEGKVVYQRDGQGNILLDGNNQPKPQLNTPGRVGVDRLLAFPGGDTKVFDLPESNLKNYIEVLGEFLTQFFATGQIPPQYLLSRMANLSGDALAGAESTLASLVKEIQLVGAEAYEGMFRRAARCAGEDWDFPDAEMVYADAEVRPFGAVVDAIGKLVANGFPKQAAWEFLPQANSQKVDRWMEMAEDEVVLDRLANAARTFTDPTTITPPNDQTEITGGASDSGG